MRLSFVNSAVLGAVLFGASALLNQAWAGVNVNNGNFYVAYTDFYLPTQGLNIDVTRTYNSRSNYVKGWFGVGWSSEIEGYVKLDKDAILFYEGGGGNIVKFEAKGKGTWVNNVFGPQSIRKVEKNYVLSSASGKELYFSEAGQLQRIADKNKNFLELVYKGDRLTLLKDNLNNQIQVKWGDAGASPRITALEAGSKKARYAFSKTGDLESATGADGITYGYNYDDEHNLIKVNYKDGTFKQMTYNKTRDWITKFRDQDGSTTGYDYISDSLDPENKFGTVVSRQKGKATEVSRFWYEFKKRADGSRYNYRAVTQIGRQVNETLFTECCGTPLAISQWNGAEPNTKDKPATWTVAPASKKTTNFVYDESGLLKKKTTPEGSITELNYNPKLKKVSSVTRNGRKIEYTYDARGNLAWAFDNGDRRKLGLTYDVKGRLTVIKEQKFVGNKPQARDVFFRYDGAGRPIEIKEKSGTSEGTIKITYAANGEVNGIFDAKGRAVASEKDVLTAQRVASTFQSLLEIVRPAGVTLGPEG